MNIIIKLLKALGLAIVKMIAVLILLVVVVAALVWISRLLIVVVAALVWISRLLMGDIDIPPHIALIVLSICAVAGGTWAEYKDL